MFSDTHCHLTYISERGIALPKLLEDLKQNKAPFIMDVGTKPGDLKSRLDTIKFCGPIPDFLYFSCGLWPDSHVIANREQSLKLLEKDLNFFSDSENSLILALGECGIDRHWNGQNAIARQAKADFKSNSKVGSSDTEGETSLFSMQLDLSKKLNLPTIVHSRDGFDATLGCIKNSGWDNGVIHCFSYGIKEARAFLDRGWYISLPGSITYPKKAVDIEKVDNLIKFLPKDRLLLETDAPFLAPVPHRGKVNTPLLISHLYDKVAGVLNLPVEELAEIVKNNAFKLFFKK